MGQRIFQRLNGRGGRLLSLEEGWNGAGRKMGQPLPAGAMALGGQPMQVTQKQPVV